MAKYIYKKKANYIYTFRFSSPIPANSVATEARILDGLTLSSLSTFEYTPLALKVAVKALLIFDCVILPTL